jgi:hypothetical protein
MTPRVAEDEMDKQIEASCKTCRRIAEMMVAEQGRLERRFRCIVTLLDEDRRPAAFSNTKATDPRTGLAYHKTELFQMCEKFSANAVAWWFPSESMEVDIDALVGSNYKVYVERLSNLVSFEVHYVRRGWRPPRPRRFFEKFWAFGETLKLVQGDNVYWKEKQHIGRVSYLRRGKVTVALENSGRNAVACMCCF